MMSERESRELLLHVLLLLLLLLLLILLLPPLLPSCMQAGSYTHLRAHETKANF